MPFARTFSEELIAEILELEGYKPILSYKCGTGKKGGKKQAADVVGLKLKVDSLYIKHVEVGAYYESLSRIVQKAREKFSAARESVIKTDHASGIDKSKVRYERVLVLPYKVSTSRLRPLRQDLSQNGIVVIGGQDLKKYIAKTVKQWKSNNATPKNPNPAIPDSLWLLKFWEFLKL